MELLEDAAVVNGQVTARDVDNGATLTYTSPVTAGYILDAATGAYTFDPSDDVYQPLAQGETLTVTVPVTVNDEHGASVSTDVVFNITGNNDNPTVEDVAAIDLLEDAAVVFGQIMADDIDHNAVLTYTAPYTAGFLLDTSTGAYTFDPSDDAYQYLTENETLAVTVAIAINDEHGALVSTNVVFNLTGINDIPFDRQINTTTTGYQYRSSVARLADGGYIITWESREQDGSGYGIYAQRYDSSGNPLGVETRANTTTTGDQRYSAVTGLAGGGYIITWTSSDGSGNGIYVQRYDSAGNPVGVETRVNTYTTSQQQDPAVTGLDDGGYIITWTSSGQDGSEYGIYSQRYDSGGNPDGNETRVNTTTASYQYRPSVTGLNDGGYIITWESRQENVTIYDIFAQRYESGGNPDGNETIVNTYTTDDQYSSAVTRFSGGGYVIAWASNGEDGSGYGIYAQRYDSSGNPDGNETRVNTYTTGDQSAPAVSVLQGGGYIITWTSDGQDGDVYGIYAQRYDSGGNPDGNETLVNTYTTGDQFSSAVTGLADGGYIITWTSSEQDGSDWGIFAKRYDSEGNPMYGQF